METTQGAVPALRRELRDRPHEPHPTKKKVQKLGRAAHGHRQAAEGYKRLQLDNGRAISSQMENAASVPNTARRKPESVGAAVHVGQEVGLRGGYRPPEHPRQRTQAKRRTRKARHGSRRSRTRSRSKGVYRGRMDQLRRHADGADRGTQLHGRRKRLERKRKRPRRQQRQRRQRQRREGQRQRRKRKGDKNLSPLPKDRAFNRRLPSEESQQAKGQARRRQRRSARRRRMGRR